MKLVLKEKVFTLKERFNVTDEAGTDALHRRRQAVFLGPST